VATVPVDIWRGGLSRFSQLNILFFNKCPCISEAISPVQNV
jgi:hypothetical protein